MDVNPYAAPQIAVDRPAPTRLLPVALASWALPVGAFALSFAFDALLPNHTSYYTLVLAASACIGFACAVITMLKGWRDRTLRVNASLGLLVTVLYVSAWLQWQLVNRRIDATIQKNRAAKRALQATRIEHEAGPD